MNHPKVSIIVPVYNVEKYLSCCMDSLLHQTLEDIEIILVDDESPDNCPALCDEYAKQDHRVRVIHKKNGGLGYARNSGIEIATGEYIAFVDSDDYVELDTYQKLYSLAIDKKTDVVYFNYQRFDNQGNTWMEPGIPKEMQYHTREETQGLLLNMIANGPKEKLDRDIQVSSCCALYHNGLIKKYGIRFKSERELASEDLLFNLDYLLHSSNVITIPHAFYYYRVNLLSLTHAARTDAFVQILIFHKYLLEMLNTNKFGEEGYLRATRHFIGYARSAVRHYVQSSLSKKEKIQCIKELVNHEIWKEVASSYPYKQLPLMYALHFYLTYKKCFRILYAYQYAIWKYRSRK